MPTHKTKLTWNDGRLEKSRKDVFVLAEVPMKAEPGRFKDLRHVPVVVAVAVPFGATGYKVYNMRDDGKMVRNGKLKLWTSLPEIKKHFESI